eukprot:SAG31_NODE_452_length_15484_cov_20.883198_3_plen_54_part_00
MDVSGTGTYYVTPTKKSTIDRYYVKYIRHYSLRWGASSVVSRPTLRPLASTLS